MEKDRQPDTSALVQVLVQLRQERDWSQVTLARRAGLGRNTVTRIEAQQVNGKTSKVDMPKPGTLRKIAEALGDGNPARTRDALHRLFAAAGYGDEEGTEDSDPAAEIALLRKRIEALEQQQITADPQQIDARVRRLLESYPPEKRAATITLLREALAEYEAGPSAPQSASSG